MASCAPGTLARTPPIDHVMVLDLALEQIPARYLEALEILVRADTAGATHGLVDYCREARMRYSIGYELTEKVRAAILEVSEDAWVPALDQTVRPANAGVLSHRHGRSVRVAEGSS